MSEISSVLGVGVSFKVSNPAVLIASASFCGSNRLNLGPILRGETRPVRQSKLANTRAEKLGIDSLVTNA